MIEIKKSITPLKEVMKDFGIKFNEIGIKKDDGGVDFLHGVCGLEIDGMPFELNVAVFTEGFMEVSFRFFRLLDSVDAYKALNEFNTQGYFNGYTEDDRFLVIYRCDPKIKDIDEAKDFLAYTLNAFTFDKVKESFNNVSKYLENPSAN